MTRRIAGAAVVTAAVLGAASAAGGHALLRQSDPSGGAALQQAPAAVTLIFTEQPEPQISTVHVLDASGRSVAPGPAQPVPGNPLALRVGVGALPQGVYTVTWRTVSRVDGHVTGGAFAFGVGVPPGPAQTAAPAGPPPSPLYVIARWGLYAGTMALVGAGWLWSLAPARVPGIWPRYLWAAWAASLLAVAGIGAAQAADAGITLGRLAGTALGTALLWRALPLLAAGAALAAAGVRPEVLRPMLALAGLGALGAMLAHVSAGHAGATEGLWRWPNVLIQWIHVGSLGIWIGGLAALLLTMRDAGAEGAGTARRFSTVAGVTLVLVAATGIARAVDLVGSWRALLDTDSGRLVLVKAVLLLALAGLGAVNRYRSVPALPRTAGRLRLVGGTELAVAALVLAVTGVLTGLAPARLVEESVQAAAPLVVSGADFATSVRVRLEISPGGIGPNRFRARVTDYDTGRPIRSGRVSLRFSDTDRPDIGTSTLALARTADGDFAADGTNLSLDGAWTVTALVEQETTAVEVRLAVTPKSRPQTVRTMAAPGQPTLYAIDLPAGRLLNTYLDPGRLGLNEVHATFIEADGRELPVPRPMTILAGRPGAPPQPLPVRRFGPGHFIADAQLGAGRWRIEFDATAADGTRLTATLTVTL